MIFLSLFFSSSGYVAYNMIRQNKELNHKNSDNYRNKVVLLKFNGNDHRHCKKNIPEKYGAKGKQKSFIVGFADSKRKGFSHYYKINNTENRSQDEPFADRFLAGEDKKESNKNRYSNRAGTIFFLGFPNRFHGRNGYLLPWFQ